MKPRILACLIALLGPTSVITPVAQAATTYTDGLAIPSRLQWNGNYGYCGEVSFISAGLYYGQYLSQYDARAIASKNARQSITSSQLLLGVNDEYAARSLRLRYEKPKKPISRSLFLAWVKGKLISGVPVIIGVYMNQTRFYGTSNLNAGDTEYDHIVTVTGFESTHTPSVPATYYPDDIITIEDHGLWTGTTSGIPPYFFRYPVGTFQKTRKGANAKTAEVYSLRSSRNYGIAITGILDNDGKTVPVRLTTSQNSETPAIVDGSNTRPAATPLTLTITMSGLAPGVDYKLYRYNTVANVPIASFNANAAKAANKWTVKISSGSTYSQTMTIMSNETAIFRALPASAP